MFQVDVFVPSADRVLKEMKAIRIWLDERRFEPATFRYMAASRGSLLQVYFTIETQARTFASAFDGVLIATSTACSTLKSSSASELGENRVRRSEPP